MYIIKIVITLSKLSIVTNYVYNRNINCCAVTSLFLNIFSILSRNSVVVKGYTCRLSITSLEIYWLLRIYLQCLINLPNLDTSCKWSHRIFTTLYLYLVENNDFKIHFLFKINSLLWLNIISIGVFQVMCNIFQFFMCRGKQFSVGTWWASLKEHWHLKLYFWSCKLYLNGIMGIVRSCSNSMANFQRRWNASHSHY